MIAAILIFSFMLAVLAHVKIFLFQRSIAALYDTLTKDTLVVRPMVYPDVDPSVLQQFYKLNEGQRKTLYHDLMGLVSYEAYSSMYKACFQETPIERAAELQASLRIMTLGEIDKLKKAIQDVMWVPKDPPVPLKTAKSDAPVPQTFVPVLKPSVPSVPQPSVPQPSAPQPSAPSASQSESAFRPIIKSETETASMPAQDSVPTSAPSSAPPTSISATTEPINEIKIAEPTKPKTRKTTTKKVLAQEAIIPDYLEA